MCGVVLSVWVAGCNIVVERSTLTTPTDYPGVTLTVGRLLPPGASGTPPPPNHAVAQIDGDIVVPPPTCYESPSGGTLCLGVIENRGAEAVSLDGVTLVVGLGRGADDRIATARPSIEQRAIPAGSIAPYRAAFETIWDPDLIAESALLPERALVPAASAPRLTAYNLNITPTSGRYTVRATLLHQDALPIAGVRAIVTLRDAAGRVIGYRVVVYEQTPLARGETLPLEVDIVPLSVAGVVLLEHPSVTIVAEALERAAAR